MTTLAAGLVLGLAGSLHCVAMCGPLVGVVSPVFGRRVTPALWYQSGRLGSYVTVGAIAGLAGAAADLAGVARGLSVVAGVAMLLMAVGQAARSQTRLGGWWTRQLTRALTAVAGVRGAHPTVSAFGAGAVNGALPCGLVYAAAMAAATTGGALEGTAVMLAFGAGTLPVMLGLWTAAARVPAAVRERLRGFTPAALAVVGVILVLRGFAGAARHIH
ncbi:MAG: sulfite exporter TauE/SafE family protein [Acidobacteria bacterium]|nr:sulfite exporter TauE/SafE family protein [Acidobacteriota bacterium]